MTLDYGVIDQIQRAIIGFTDLQNNKNKKLTKGK
jgi:hypothetical protein